MPRLQSLQQQQIYIFPYMISVFSFFSSVPFIGVPICYMLLNARRWKKNYKNMIQKKAWKIYTRIYIGWDFLFFIIILFSFLLLLCSFYGSVRYYMKELFCVVLYYCKYITEKHRNKLVWCFFLSEFGECFLRDEMWGEKRKCSISCSLGMWSPFFIEFTSPFSPTLHLPSSFRYNTFCGKWIAFFNLLIYSKFIYEAATTYKKKLQAALVSIEFENEGKKKEKKA